MRTAAQIEPVALLVNLERLIFRNGVDQFDLEVLAFVGEHLLGLVARPDFLGEGLIARDDLLHLFLDDGQVFRRERLVARKIVIESVLDHRADGHLRARPQVLHGFGQHMGGVVPDQFQRARIVARHELDFGVFFDFVGEIDDGAVERHGHGALGQRGRNALGDLKTGNVVGIFAACAVGKGQSDHGLFSCCSLPRTSVGKRGFEQRYSRRIGRGNMVDFLPQPAADHPSTRPSMTSSHGRDHQRAGDFIEVSGSPRISTPSRMAVTGISSVTSMTLVAPARARIMKNTM